MSRTLCGSQSESHIWLCISASAKKICSDLCGAQSIMRAVSSNLRIVHAALYNYQANALCEMTDSCLKCIQIDLLT